MDGWMEISIVSTTSSSISLFIYTHLHNLNNLSNKSSFKPSSLSFAFLSSTSYILHLTSHLTFHISHLTHSLYTKWQMSSIFPFATHLKCILGKPLGFREPFYFHSFLPWFIYFFIHQSIKCRLIVFFFFLFFFFLSFPSPDVSEKVFFLEDLSNSSMYVIVVYGGRYICIYINKQAGKQAGRQAGKQATNCPMRKDEEIQRHPSLTLSPSLPPNIRNLFFSTFLPQSKPSLHPSIHPSIQPQLHSTKRKPFPRGHWKPIFSP